MIIVDVSIKLQGMLLMRCLLIALNPNQHIMLTHIYLG